MAPPGEGPKRRRVIGAMAAAVAAAGRAGAAPEPDPAIVEGAGPRSLGAPVGERGYGLPSPHEAAVQRRTSPGMTRTPQSSVAFTPLQSLFGILTPNGLHFERAHHGRPEIDPAQHRLLLHGLVRQPRVFTMDDLLRLPSVSRIHFIECGANTGMEWARAAVPSVQYTHGMLSCAEWTGVPLATLLELCGADTKRGRFVLAEGADAGLLTRTLPMANALDDVLVAYGQNGEMLRPENGYPLRLVAPGLQGVSSVKWLRRLEVGDQPFYTREEQTHYVDLLPDGRQREYTSVQECKSVITAPSGGQVIQGRGYVPLSGLAWSGRGRVTRVDVSTDGGRQWRPARLDGPVLPKALTRFHADWTWGGEPALLQSRAVDETGYVQPTLAQLRAVRGIRGNYHQNAIHTWAVAASGEVSNVQLAP